MKTKKKTPIQTYHLFFTLLCLETLNPKFYPYSSTLRNANCPNYCPHFLLLSIPYTRCKRSLGFLRITQDQILIRACTLSPPDRDRAWERTWPALHEVWVGFESPLNYWQSWTLFPHIYVNWIGVENSLSQRHHFSSLTAPPLIKRYQFWKLPSCIHQWPVTWLWALNLIQFTNFNNCFIFWHTDWLKIFKTLVETFKLYLGKGYISMVLHNWCVHYSWLSSISTYTWVDRCFKSTILKSSPLHILNIYQWPVHINLEKFLFQLRQSITNFQPHIGQVI